MASFGKEVQCVLLIEGLTIQQRLVWVLFPTLLAFGYLNYKWIVVLYTGVCSVVKYVIVLWQLIPLGTGSDFARTFGWYVCFLSRLIYIWHVYLLTSVFCELVLFFNQDEWPLWHDWSDCERFLSWYFLFYGVWSAIYVFFVNGWSMNSCMETEHSDLVLCALYYWLQYS